MSFSEFYQRSINEPEQFWAEQARRIDWQTPFTQTLDHSNPICATTLSTAGWRNSQRHWH